MTKRELEKALKQHGFIKYSGGKHDIGNKPGFPTIPVPRHKGDIPNGTLKNIIKHAGLKDLL